MDKNKVITVLGILVGLLTITLIVNEIRGGGGTGTEAKGRVDVKTNDTEKAISVESKTSQKETNTNETDRGGSTNPPPEPKPEPNEENVGKTWIDKNGVTNIVTKTETISDGKTNTVVEVAPKVRSVTRRPLEPEATKRLHDGPVVISSLFEASGLGEHASYGTARRGSYLYSTVVTAKSEVVEMDEDKMSGRVRVVERRKFLAARDHIALSDLDIALALDTLPVDQVKSWVDNACTFVCVASIMITKVAPVTAPYTAIVGGGAATAKAAVSTAFTALHAIDGTSARGLLGAFGVKIPKNLEAFANEWASQLAEHKLHDVHAALQTIEGKSFLITYTQDANGKPLNVDYTNEDGKPITDVEWEILRSANVFLDSNVVPNVDYRVGDSWTIWADEVMDMFGMAGNGSTDGKITVERVADQDDGTWTLKIARTEIEYKSDNGESAGTMLVKDGNGLVDAKNFSVKSLHATAEGGLRHLNKKRHFLFFDFVKRVKGNSNLRFTLTVDPAKKDPQK